MYIYFFFIFTYSLERYILVVHGHTVRSVLWDWSERYPGLIVFECGGLLHFLFRAERLPLAEA